MKIASSRNLKRAVGPALAAGLLVTALATPAAAQTPGSTAFRLFGSAYLSARAGAQNQMSASVSGGRLILSDTSGVALGPGCVRVSATSADCGAVATVGGISIGMGDLNDSFQSNLALRTLVDAGTGTDTVATGGGNDTIGVSDGAPGDTVTCDGGADTVFRDVGDSIAADCERRF
ncbi:MAG: hypothetical protein HOZ81_17805 [Streptomyces sp.]|nr:hypothetical protein [Streptomyces sp.]